MTTPDPLLGPFITTKLTDYRDMPGYAKTPDPAGTPSRARLLREEAMGR